MAGRSSAGAGIQLRADLAPAVRHRQPQCLQGRFRIEAIQGMTVGTVHQYPVTRLGEQHQGQDKPGMLLPLARVAGPVEVGLEGRVRLQHFLAAGVDKAREFLAGLFFYPQQHEERTHLHQLGFTPQDHTKSLPRLVPAQGAAAAFALAEHPHKRCKAMFQLRAVKAGVAHLALLETIGRFRQAGNFTAKPGR